MQEESTIINYTTTEDVLKEAGFYHIQQNEALAGAVDGSNRTFVTTYKPLLNVNAIVVMVNGIKANISATGATTGSITLQQAPAAGAEALAEYYYSAVDADFTSKCLADAKSFIDRYMNGYDPCSPYGENGKTIPSVVEQVCRLYAAGLLLIKDYGYNTDTELTSKDGYKKIAFAKETLTDFRNNGGLCGGGGDDGANGSIGNNAARSGGNFIERDFMRERPCSDSCFDRGF